MTLTLRSVFVGLLALGWLPAHAADVGTAANWFSHGGGYDESGYSQLDSINTQTVGRLGLAWTLDLPGERTLEATPLAVDGVLYFTGNLATVYAVDGASGKLLWTCDPEVWKHNPAKMHFTLPVNRGAAYEDGRVFVGTLDGRLIALDAKTGKDLWSVQTLPLDTPHTSTGAPRVFKGKVIIGNAGADYGARGFVTAYDAKTGKQLWRFYTAPGSPEENKGDPAMELAASTWTGEYWKTGTGGTAWNGLTFDPEMNRVYIGAGNSGPYDPAVRSPGGGDNLFLASIVAVDADTGKYIWHYQVNPREAWDFKATANMIATTLTIDGTPRKVLMQAPTNGFFYVIDRTTGKLISAEKFGKATWADHIDLKTGRPVEMPNIRYETGETIMWPASLGAHNWQDMSFSPKSGLVYIPYMQMGTKLTKRKIEGVSAVQLSMAKMVVDPEDGKGALIAWDPIAQKARWKVQYQNFWNGATLATAGGLVFQGTADGYLMAYDAASGKQVWRFYVSHGVLAAPISYAVGGKQCISVLAGYGASWGEISNTGWKFDAPRRLLTFCLDAKGKLPPTSPPDFVVHALDDPALKITEADVQAGETVFLSNCVQCHGVHLITAGAPGPDLRESQMALHLDDLWSVVHDGALLQGGMPQYADITREQVRQLFTYIRAGARESLGLRKAQQAPAAGKSGG